MPRSKLKRIYHVLIAVALLMGFALGYSLKGSGTGSEVVRAVSESAADQAFPGCRTKYREIKRAFTYGPYVRSDYRDVLQELSQAIEEHEGYLPYHFLLATIYEDWMVNTERGVFAEAEQSVVAEQIGLPADATPDAIVRAARKRAVEIWEKAGRYALCRDVATYGLQWRVIRDQHLSALRDRREFQVTRDEAGALDLVEVYNIYAITRDHDRYVNNLSSARQGYSFEGKHMPDVLYCPNHPDVGFQFPCIRYLPSEGNTSIREDIEFFRTAFGIDGQKLDIEDAQISTIHLLAFNVSSEGRPVRAVVQLAYAGGREQAKHVLIGPWRQSDSLLRDTALRQQLDPAYRDSELHKCNGEELEMASSPAYIYHVSIPADSRARLDKISFPRYDPTTTGLEDPGIADVRIVAITLQMAGE